MTSKIPRALIILAIAVALPAIASAQPAGRDTMRWYQQNTDVVLRNARQLIEPTLPRNERDIDRSIDYRVTTSPGIGAFAAYEGGKRVVAIHPGTIQMMDWFFESISIERNLGITGCYKDFASYVFRIVEENNRRYAQGLSLRPALPPQTYVKQSSGACRGAPIERLLSDSAFGKDKAGSIEAGIMFLYLHELGHHVLKHVEGKRTTDPAGLKMSRNQEDEADRFAIRSALKANYDLSAAVSWYAFMSTFGGDSIEAEVKSTHPLGIRRALVLYQETLLYYRSHPEAWSDRSTYASTMTRIESQIADLQRIIDSIQ